jgi:hypothetical protein
MAIIPAFLLFFVLAPYSIRAGGQQDMDPGKAPESGTLMNQTAEETAVPGKSPGEPDLLTVSGRVRLVGSALFSRIVVTDGEDNDWYVENQDREILASLEQRPVTVRGKPEYRDIIMANGKKAGVQRFLRDITLVE